MSRLTPNTSSRKFCLVLILSLVALTVLTGQAHATDVVTTYKDELGWKLQVNGEDFYVKGVNWGYTPRMRISTTTSGANPLTESERCSTTTWGC